MKESMLVKVSKNGQMVIPAKFRHQYELENGGEVEVSKNNDGDLVVKPVNNLPSWDDLLKGIPEETIKTDKKGHYDSKKHPDFSDWMING